MKEPIQGPQFIVDLGLVRLSEGADTTTRIPICMVGTFYKGKQKFSVTKADVKTMAANLAKRGGDVVMDYEHASEFPEVAAGGPIPAAGWIRSLDDAPDANGVVWGTVNFTPKAAGMIAAQEYKYVSPVIDWGARDRSTGDQQGATLTSAALTNRPVLDKMPAIRLSEAAGWQPGAESDALQQIQDSTGEGEDVAKTNDQKCGTCGGDVLCPKCDSDEMQSLMMGSEAGRRVVALSDVARSKDGLMDFSSIPRKSLISLEVLEECERQHAVLSEVKEYLYAGKITPAQMPAMRRMALSDVESFRTFVKTLPQQVQLGEVGLGGSEKPDEATMLSHLATQRAKEKDLPIHEAMKQILSENRDLRIVETPNPRQVVFKR